jgi:PKHD-type hydroxylase
MSFQTFKLLTSDEVVLLNDQLREEAFVDGRATAKTVPLTIKNNLQFGRQQHQQNDHASSKLVEAALRRNPEFLQYTLARAWVVPSFSRYEVGMYYRDHVDAAVMSTDSGAVRTDFAMTLFLTDPKTYEGGALVLRSAYGEEEIKLEAGQAVVYQANLIHRVEPVSAGTRLVALTWIQSQIADERFRQINQDLHQALSRLDHSKTDLEAVNLIVKAQQNLIRTAASGS